MLRKKFSLNKKGMTLQTIVVMVLAAFAFLVLIIIGSNKIFQADSIGKDCVASGGVCVESNKCGACSNYASCKLKFSQECESEKNEKLICCPSSELI